MKKNLVLGLGIIGLGALALAGCNKGAKINKVSFEDAYDTSILSGISLLESNASNSLMSYQSTLMSKSNEDKEDKEDEANKDEANKDEANKDEANKDASLTDSMKKDILDNLAILKSTLNGSSKKSDPVKSDKSEWEMMYTITQNDLNGDEVVYTFYYTEAGEALEADKKDDEEDNEIERDIKGIVLAKDQEYQVSGKREIEGDEEEVEYKVVIDANNYVVIESEVEGNENEYEFSKFVDGKMVFSREVEYEINKNGEVEIEFEMKDSNNEEISLSYEFIKKEDIDYIKVEIEKGKEEAEALIRVVKDNEGNLSYVFE